MQAAVRASLLHLAGFAAPHVLAALTLGIIRFNNFRPGGESANPAEALMLQLFISGIVLALCGLGYAAAIALCFPRPARLPLPFFFGAVAGAVTLALSGFGGWHRLADSLGLAWFAPPLILGLLAGAAMAMAGAFTGRRSHGSRSD